MFFALDRIEENTFAVLTDDNGKVYNENLGNLPANSRIGDIFVRENGVYKLAEDETHARKKRIEEKRTDFFNKLKKKQEDIS